MQICDQNAYSFPGFCECAGHTSCDVYLGSVFHARLAAERPKTHQSGHIGVAQGKVHERSWLLANERGMTSGTETCFKHRFYIYNIYNYLTHRTCGSAWTLYVNSRFSYETAVSSTQLTYRWPGSIWKMGKISWKFHTWTDKDQGHYLIVTLKTFMFSIGDNNFLLPTTSSLGSCSSIILLRLYNSTNTWCWKHHFNNDKKKN